MTRYRNPRRIVLEGDSPPLIVEIAGWRYVFTVTDAGDAAFNLIEFAPGGERTVIAAGAEQCDPLQDDRG